MSNVITAVYEHGVLNPLTPLDLQEHQRVHVHIVPEYPEDTVEHVLEWLASIGRLTSPRQDAQAAPVSNTERIHLSQLLGEATPRPLSEVILEERGER